MQNNSRRISLVLGAFMAFVLIAGVVLPLFDRGGSTQQAPDPTTPPTPTFPAPITDFSGITFDDVYLHPSGLYTVAQPTGWEILAPMTQNGIAQVGMNNGVALSVIDIYVQEPTLPVSTAQDLSASLTRDTLAQTWTRYNRWEETNRSIENDRLVIDFAIQANRQQYVARQISWTEAGKINSVRVVVPENAIDLLRYLLDNLPGTLTPLAQTVTTPFEWQTYYDPIVNHTLRYPQNWTVQAAAPGRTASLVGANGESLRLDVQAVSGVLDEAAARSFLESAVPNATILSLTPITRELGSGFSIAYTTTSADGEPFSGLAAIVGSSDGNLHSANLRFPGREIDLNNLPTAPETTPEPTADPTAATPETPPTTAPLDMGAVYRDYALIMSTFRVIESLNLAPQNLPPTATALPTLPASATPVASNTPEAAATLLPTATSVPSSTPVPPTSTPLPPTNTRTPASATPALSVTATQSG